MNVPQILTNLHAHVPDSDLIHVIIETPKHHRNKLDYDEKLGLFRLKKVLPLGTSFPYDFGFIPSTRAADGDPLDILVLTEESVCPGCLLTVRLLGVIEAEQSEKKKKIRNDRLIGIFETKHNPPDVKSLKDMMPHAVQQIEQFFISYNYLEGREFKPLARRGPKVAERLVSDGMKRFKQSMSQNGQ